MIPCLILTGLTAVALYALFRRFTCTPLSHIRGPKSSSFFFGHLLEIFQHAVGETDFKWQRTHGNLVRFKGALGEDCLFITDPKALSSIFNKSTYHYPKMHNLRAISRMVNGQGISWAEGDVHKRQRRIITPAFGGPETKAFLSIFMRCAESMSSKWMKIIASSREQNVVFNVSAWLSRGTLDAIGQAAFGVQFGAIENDEHPLAKKYNNLLVDIFGHPSALQIFILNVTQYLPSCLLNWMIDHGSGPRLERARDLKMMMIQVAKELLQEKAGSLLAGKESRDVLGLLVKANMDSEAKNKLTDVELFSQMRTIMFAGHQTTSSSLSWILFELARHPKMQSRLRVEIREMQGAIRARGDTQFTITDFDAMPYTIAVIKEGLRYHPVVSNVQRIAAKNDILPLSGPITTDSGEVSEILVPKGTRILVSIAAYNRNTELWGDDANEFNPDRWLDGVAAEKKAVSVGVYSNLMTFLGGTRACLGWRFAVIEMQAFLVDVVGKFKFAMTDRSERVYRCPFTMMAPMVEGELEHGSQLPLAVSVAPQDKDVNQ